MKKIDVSDFVLSLKDELDSFEQYQTTYSTTQKKKMSDWVDSFMNFAGYNEDEDDDDFDDYEEELYYGDSYEFEQIVNRRKYRSFRDDDSY